MSELGFTPQQQLGHTEVGPRFNVSSERPVKREIELVTALIV